MVSRTWSATLKGIDGEIVGIESSRQPSLPKIQITGLPGEAIRESRERVRACLVQFGFEVPSSHILVHLWPANSKKVGSQLDLAIAIAVLGAEGLIPVEKLCRTALLGELTITGELLPVSGAVGLLEALIISQDIDFIILPAGNSWEAALMGSPKIRTAGHFGEVLDFINGKTTLATPVAPCAVSPSRRPLLDGIRGTLHGKRAVEIALTGRHHLLLVGAPGVGKTLLAKAAQSLLPPLNASEVPTVLKTYSVYPHEKRSPWERPFRAPHHSVSPAGLLGGGKGIVSPGEVTLAHLGVLFLDEFPEFRRDAIEGLREPLQNGNIRVQRIGAGAPFPALFTLIAAMNPCPCGYALSSKKLCYCTREQKNRYQRKISGPIVERIDLYVSLNFVGQEASDITLSKQEQVIKRMEKAFARQLTRYKDPFLRNGDANRELYNDAFQLGEAETLWWQNQAVPNARNHRMLDKLIRVARTIADLDDQERILVCHLQEAWLFRCAPQQISGWH